MLGTCWAHSYHMLNTCNCNLELQNKSIYINISTFMSVCPLMWVALVTVRNIFYKSKSNWTLRATTNQFFVQAKKVEIVMQIIHLKWKDQSHYLFTQYSWFACSANKLCSIPRLDSWLGISLHCLCTYLHI